MQDLCELDLAALRDGLRGRTFSSRELVSACLQRMEAKRHLNAFISETPDQALAKADRADDALTRGEGRALEGIPLAVKDIFCTEEAPTTAGSRILADFKPLYESTVTARLWDAGAIMLGKTNMDEFAMGSSNLSSAFGPVRSPIKRRGSNVDLVPGGSSGGSAAAVRAGVTPAALGTDTGGSIRQPASFCGIVGLKPTYGRCSRWGVVAYASSLEQPGPLGRTVRDVAILLQEMAGADPRDSTCADAPVPTYEAAVGRSGRGLRVGVPVDYRHEGLRPDVVAQWDRGVAALRDAGVEVVDVELPMSRYALAAYYIIAPAEASSNLARYDGVRYGASAQADRLDDLYMQTRSAGFGDEVQRRVLIGTYVLSAGYYDAYYKKAQKVRRLIADEFDHVLSRVDALLFPTSPIPAFGLDEKEYLTDPLANYLIDIFTVPANLVGLPAMSVPFGLSSEHLPLGLQVLGRRFGEETVLTLGEILFQARAEPRPAPT